jgi:DNA-binding XRE family transcriptional regulator
MAVIRVKEVMDQKNISREKLAEMVGVSKTTITNIRKEDNLPTITLLVKIAEALDVDVRELFVPTKGGIITPNEIIEARDLIEKASNILNIYKKN